MRDSDGDSEKDVEDEEVQETGEKDGGEMEEEKDGG